MNGTDLDDVVPPLRKRLVAGGIYSIFTAIGFLANIALFVVLVRKRSYFAQFSFYTLVWHLLISDCGMLTSQLVVAVPLSFAGRPLYGGALLHVLCTMDTLFFMSVFNLSCLITFNRFISFFQPHINEALFSRKNIQKTCFASWVIAFSWLGTSLAIGCPKSFRADKFYFYQNCTPNISSFGNFMVLSHSIITTAWPYLNLVLYLCAFVKMKMAAARMQHTSSRVHLAARKRERSFMIQVFVISLVLQMEVVCFQFLPDIVTLGWLGEYEVNLFMDWIIIINSSVNPLIYFTFNHAVRQGAAEIFQAVLIMTSNF